MKNTNIHKINKLKVKLKSLKFQLMTCHLVMSIQEINDKKIEIADLSIQIKKLGGILNEQCI